MNTRIALLLGQILFVIPVLWLQTQRLHEKLIISVKEPSQSSASYFFGLWAEDTLCMPSLWQRLHFAFGLWDDVSILNRELAPERFPYS